ncbi:hypothetical protein RUM43_002264 [Polyplax serrata]|uniref:CUB domain-containing protein n=1 Tax=Polyplax serrata TaxID=468196 RepID=A0AAN8P222_POLSC
MATPQCDLTAMAAANTICFDRNSLQQQLDKPVHSNSSWECDVLDFEFSGAQTPVLKPIDTVNPAPGCLNRADLIRIYDGGSSTFPVIRYLCNELSAVEILSTGPDLYIEFVANSEWPGQGFKANYKFQTLDGENGNVLVGIGVVLLQVDKQVNGALSMGDVREQQFNRRNLNQVNVGY